MDRFQNSALAALFAASTAFGTANAAETVTQRALGLTGTCLTKLSGDWGDGSRCLSDRLGGVLMDEAAHYMTEQGQRVFGEHFRLVHRMSWSPLGQGLAGELDAVIPLSFRAGVQPGAESEALQGSAFFLQQGMTRWTDEHGFKRNDVRLGTAYRLALPHFAGANVVGATALVQKNLERGHQRFVLGTDYAGRWGHVALQHYVPTTEWRPGRSGYEDRAVGGTEVSLRLGLTTTLSLDTAMGPVGARRHRAVHRRRAPRPRLEAPSVPASGRPHGSRPRRG